MEYEFIHDPTTGSARAKFSIEHENLGPWLEIELGDNTKKLTELLIAIDDVESKNKAEVVIVGHEFSVIIDNNDVTIKSNAVFNPSVDDSDIPEGLTVSTQNAISGCGLEDFRELLLSWSKFIT